MAKVLIEFDTVSKQLTITSDGQAMTDVNGVYINKGYSRCCDGYSNEDPPPFHLEISRMTEDKNNKTITWTRVTAAEHGSLVETAVAAPTAKVVQDVADYYGR